LIFPKATHEAVSIDHAAAVPVPGLVDEQASCLAQSDALGDLGRVDTVGGVEFAEDVRDVDARCFLADTPRSIPSSNAIVISRSKWRHSIPSHPTFTGLSRSHRCSRSASSAAALVVSSVTSSFLS
jgi:hypothetical protein